MTATTATANLKRAPPASTRSRPTTRAQDDPALIAFTSGTTGVPKGCVHFHRDILAPCDTFAKTHFAMKPGDIVMTSAPIAFTFGLGATLLFPLRFGAADRDDRAADPAAMLEAIAKHGVTHLATAPTAYKAMLSQPGLDDALKSLTTCLSAGEHLPEATWHAWQDRTGIAIVDGIGATEMMHIFISASGDAIRPGSTGSAVPGYEAAILDPDGKTLAEGEGRLAIRGPTGCRYLDDPRQADYVQNGWNITGDTYAKDADGYFWYRARSDDMIVSSGYNIAAPEVENALLAHPAVAECAVIGVPCDERGQKVKAFIVLADFATPSDELADKLKDFVKEQHRPLQISARDRVRRRAAQDRDGQTEARGIAQPLMAARIAVRQAQIADIEPMHRIRLAVTENRLGEPGRIGHSSYIPFVAAGSAWVAEGQGAITGFAIIDAEERSVWALFVDPAVEGQGVGRALHEWMLAWARRQGFQRLSLTTGRATRAEQFYRSAGWSEVGRTDAGDLIFERSA